MATFNINLNNVQPLLVSGTNIKTINGSSILGSGNLTIAVGVSIGDSIGSGTAKNVLYLGTAGVLTQSSNFTYDDSEGLCVMGGGGTGAIGTRALKLKTTSNPELQLIDTSSGVGLFITEYSGYVYIGRTNGIGGYVSYGAMYNQYTQSWSFGSGANPSATIHVKGFAGGTQPTALFETNDATNIGVIIKGTTSQSGDLLQLKDVTGSIILNGFNKDGYFISTSNIWKFAGGGSYTIDTSTGGVGDLRFLYGSGGGWSYNFYTGAIASYGHRVRISDNGLQVGLGNIDGSARLHVKSISTTDITLIVQGTTSQSADLLQLKDVSNNVLTAFDSAGRLVFYSIPTSASGLASGTVWNDGGTLKIV